MIDRSTDVRGALRRRQRGFIIDPFKFGPPPVTDPQWSNVVFYLPGQGVNGGTSFPDVGPNALTFSAIGGVQTSTAVAIHGTSSIAFNSATSDALQHANLALARLQATDFTIEGHFHPLTLHNGCLFAQRDTSTGNGWESWLLSDGSAFLQASSGSPNNVSSAASSYAAGVTVPIAMTGVYNAGTPDYTLRFFIGGVLLATATGPVIANETGVNLSIGSRSNTTVFFNGYGAHLRLTLAARYTATYTPDTPPYPTS